MACTGMAVAAGNALYVFGEGTAIIIPMVVLLFEVEEIKTRSMFPREHLAIRAVKT
jgi:hypothetical protein